MADKKQNFNEVKNQQFGSALPKAKRQDKIYQEEGVCDMKNFVFGAVVGGVIGAAAALLYAPKTGKDMRDDVGLQVSHLKVKVAEGSSAAIDKTFGAAEELTKSIQKQSTQLVDKVKNLKTDNAPLDDGTVSSEGEEPLTEEKPVEA